MVIVTAFMSCNPADRERAIAAAADVARGTQAEDGCIEYRFWEATETPGTFMFFERWRDQEALNAHFQTPHIAEFRAAAGSIWTEREVVFYDVEKGRTS